VARVREQAWPNSTDPDALHDALLLAGFLTWDELGAGAGFVTRLAAKRRAVRLEIPDGAVILCATERLPELAAAVPPSGSMDPTIVAGIPSSIPFPTDRDHALRELVRSRLECLGPIRATDLARPPGPARERPGTGPGGAGTGRLCRAWPLRPGPGRRAMVRTLAAGTNQPLHGGRTAQGNRPVSPAAYMRFLLYWQGLAGNRVEGIEGTGAVLDRLAGFSIPAAAWEAEVLPARVAAYTPDLLDGLTVSGRYVWLRLDPGQGGKTPIRTTPTAILRREMVALWRPNGPAAANGLSSRAGLLLELLQDRGTRFFADLVRDSGLLRTKSQPPSGELLVAAGRVTADGFAGLRALIAPAASSATTCRRRGNASPDPIDRAGRWDALPALDTDGESESASGAERPPGGTGASTDPNATAW